jgi:rhodanese-related sulfurtransferase
MGNLNSRLWAAVFAATALTIAGCGGVKDKFEKEVDNETLAVNLTRQTLDGDYDLITTSELKALIDEGADVLIVDTMPLEMSYRKAHVPSAKQFLFPKEGMEEWDSEQTDGKSQEDYEKLLGENKDKPLVIYCGFVKCGRSHNGALWARRLGYTDVRRYPGGIYAWKGAGYPTEAGN